MKTAILTICIALSGFRVFADPPDSKPEPTNATVNVVAPAGVPVDGIILYGGNHQDANWTRVKVLPCTNLQYMAATVPKYEIYTATSTNSATRQESNYAPKVYWPTNPQANPIPVLQLNK